MGGGKSKKLAEEKTNLGQNYNTCHRWPRKRYTVLGLRLATTTLGHRAMEHGHWNRQNHCGQRPCAGGSRLVCYWHSTDVVPPCDGGKALGGAQKGNVPPSVCGGEVSMHLLCPWEEKRCVSCEADNADGAAAS